ncbi:hypothetical protein TEA_026103 [Camellia sinensis var. sinensis]|uniref:BZIP domain-containing protein n=1 Tax=Camellia sinensis var. sinensis TaxID=542762 RepID=A0A4S4EKC9_CAMSN|nr:hypothetical protein TEA_026103 [Camellia sinensis var. sinensis]
MATRASTSSDSTSVTWSDSAAAAAEEEEEDCGCENSECGGDAMIKNELEAAEALTSLAHSTRCSNQRAGPSQRVKTESTTVDAVANLELSLRLLWRLPFAFCGLHKCLMLATGRLRADQAAVAQQQCENICTVMMEGAKVEQDAELPEPSPKCSTSYASFCGSKSRKKLTEAEKEEKRIRRVLANRESARQTIRRRQANHAELTRKAASLTLENLNLKQVVSGSTFPYILFGAVVLELLNANILAFTELIASADNSIGQEKELAVSEYEHLRSRNEYLKAQMAMTEGEVEETKIDSKSTNADISTPLCPYFIYNQPPYTPFLWPAIIQPSNPVQIKNGSQNSIIVPSDVPMPAIAKPNSFQEQENPQNINSPGTPLFIMPCPWFFPFPDHGNGLQSRPSFDLNDEQNGTLMNNQGSANSSSIAHAEKHHHSLPINVKTEASGSTEAMPANVVVSSTVSHTVTVLSELKQDLIVCSSKKNMDAVAAAAEARKKRKELTKLKNLHCRQFRMRC